MERTSITAQGERMKITKTASGTKKITMSKNEWKQIGIKAGWIGNLEIKTSKNSSAFQQKEAFNRNYNNKGRIFMDLSDGWASPSDIINDLASKIAMMTSGLDELKAMVPNLDKLQQAYDSSEWSDPNHNQATTDIDNATLEFANASAKLLGNYKSKRERNR